MQHYFFFDFDSTLCTKESLDKLIYYCLTQQGQYSADIQHRIQAITDDGMNGNATLHDTITQRLALTTITRQNIKHLANTLTKQLTPGIENTIKQLQQAGHYVAILSGGFMELIIPSAEKLNINISNVYANKFIFDGEKVIGLDSDNPACQPASKPFWIQKITQSHHALGKKVMIGDGSNDLEAKEIVDYFIGFGVNINREIVKKNSPFFVTSVSQLNHIIKHNILT